ncbi:MAG: hypothetical protein WBB28_27110 [Crinalium sp.]
MFDESLIAPKYASLTLATQQQLDEFKDYIAAHPEEVNQILLVVFRNFLILREENLRLTAEKQVLKHLNIQMSETLEKIQQLAAR